MRFINIKDFYPLFVIALMKMVNGFPSPKPRELVVKGIAFAAYQFSRNKRRHIEKNLFEVFDGKLDENRKQQIVKRNFFHFWQENFSLLPSGKERAAIQRVDIRGIEHLQQALEKGRGVILWESTSFGKRVLSKQILHEKGFSIHQVHADIHFEGFPARRPFCYVGATSYHRKGFGEVRKTVCFRDHLSSRFGLPCFHEGSSRSIKAECYPMYLRGCSCRAKKNSRKIPWSHQAIPHRDGQSGKNIWCIHSADVLHLGGKWKEKFNH